MTSEDKPERRYEVFFALNSPPLLWSLVTLAIAYLPKEGCTWDKNFFIWMRAVALADMALIAFWTLCWISSWSHHTVCYIASGIASWVLKLSMVIYGTVIIGTMSGPEITDIRFAFTCQTSYIWAYISVFVYWGYLGQGICQSVLKSCLWKDDQEAT